MTALSDQPVARNGSMYTAEDVESFLEFVTAHMLSLGHHFDLKQLLRRYAEAALRNEIDNMSMNRHDEDSDHEWLRSVEDLAERAEIID